MWIQSHRHQHEALWAPLGAWEWVGCRPEDRGRDALLAVTIGMPHFVQCAFNGFELLLRGVLWVGTFEDSLLLPVVQQPLALPVREQSSHDDQRGGRLIGPHGSTVEFLGGHGH